MTRIDIISKAVDDASSYLMDHYRRRHTEMDKADHSTLLGEDLKSEEIITGAIKKNFPSDAIIAEESIENLTGDYSWIIDPLCGTFSYLRGVETWSVSVALVHNGVYEFGIVSQPVLEQVFIGQISGATLNGKSIHISDTNELSESFISVEHNVFIDEKVDILNLIKNIKRIRVGHGSGAELGYVAAGYLDALIKTGQSPEHYSGGRAVLESAGGIFVDFTGKPLPVISDKNLKIDYIATNPILLKYLLRFIHNAN